MAKPVCQLLFFIDFLKTASVFDALVAIVRCITEVRTQGKLGLPLSSTFFDSTRDPRAVILE
jgi:hypothetical protein